MAATIAAAGSEIVAVRPSLVLGWSAATRGVPAHLLADPDGAVAISEDGRVTALAKDGSEQWTTDVGEGRAVVFQDLPSLGAGLVVVPANEQEAVALERGTGRERWRIPFANVHSTSAGTDDAGTPLAALVDRAGSLRLVDAASGNTRWSAQLPHFEDHYVHMWFGSDRLMVQWTPIETGSRLAAFDVMTGAIVWSREMKAASLPSVARSSVYFAEVVGGTRRTSDVEVRSLDLATGGERWMTSFRSRSVYFTSASSAVEGDALAIVDLHGQVRLLRAQDGTMRWKHATHRMQYEAELRIAGDVVAMSTYGTGLVAMSTLDGEQVSTEPIGRVQYGVTIESTAAVGDRLYLLVTRNGEQHDRGEVWSFRASR